MEIKEPEVPLATSPNAKTQLKAVIMKTLYGDVPDASTWYAITLSPYKFKYVGDTSYKNLLTDVKKQLSINKDGEIKQFTVNKAWFVLEYHKDGYGHYHGIINVSQILDTVYHQIRSKDTFAMFAKSRLSKTANSLIKETPNERWVDYMVKEYLNTIQQNYDSVNYRYW